MDIQPKPSNDDAASELSNSRHSATQVMIVTFVGGVVADEHGEVSPGLAQQARMLFEEACDICCAVARAAPQHCHEGVTHGSLSATYRGLSDRLKVGLKQPLVGTALSKDQVDREPAETTRGFGAEDQFEVGVGPIGEYVAEPRDVRRQNGTEFGPVRFVEPEAE